MAGLVDRLHGPAFAGGSDSLVGSRSRGCLIDGIHTAWRVRAAKIGPVGFVRTRSRPLSCVKAKVAIETP